MRFFALRALLILLAILLIIAKSGIAFCSVEIDTVEISGVDRSNIDLVTPSTLVRLSLDSQIESDRSAVSSPFSLGPFSVWSRIGIGNKSTYTGSFVTGLTLETIVGDLSGSYITRDGVSKDEEYGIGDSAVSLTWIRSDGFTLRFASQYLAGKYDLMGPVDIVAPSTRNEEAFLFSIDAGYKFSDMTEVHFGVFYDYYEVDRVDSSSERRYGLSGLLLREDLSISMKLWAYSFSHGEDDAYASFEARHDKLVRTGDVSVGSIFGVHLVNGSRIYLSPRLTAGWDASDRFKLNGVAGIVHSQPTLAEAVFRKYQVDPFIDVPDTSREFVAEISGRYAINEYSKIELSLSYRDISRALYYEREADGYLRADVFEDVEVLGFGAKAEIRLTDRVKLTGWYRFSHAEFPHSDTNYPYLPISSTSVRMDYYLTSRWSAKLEIEFRGGVFAYASRDDKISGYTVVNAELNYSIESYLSFFVRGENITNASYEIYEGWRGFSSCYLFGVEIRF